MFLASPSRRLRLDDTLDARHPDPDGYAGVERDGQQIHFWKCDDRAIPKVSGFRMEVTDIEALYERCQAAGIVHPNAHLEDKPWGFRQFGINDPDENLLMFAQEL